jgi:quercetin dioxygenase-like cupin family protein
MADPKDTAAPDDAAETMDEALMDSLAGALAPIELSSERREAMRTRILGRIADQPPPGTRTLRANEGEWIRVNELVHVRLLRQDIASNSQTVMIRMLPGAEVVAHRHTQEEECVILEGEVTIGAHRLRAGDVHLASPGAKHAPIRTVHGALLMIRSEIPPQQFSMV